MTLKRYKQIIVLVAGLTLVVLGLTISLYWQEQNRPHVEVVFLDIGQGDSILIKTKYHQNILIDAGPDAKVLDRLGRNLSFAGNKLDLVIATHPDADHVAGLVDVVKRYQVDLVLEPGIVHRTGVYQVLEDIIARQKIPQRWVESRQRYDLGDNLWLDILYPNVSFVGQELADTNSASIVAKLSDGEVDYLFTGDATTEVEQQIVGDYGSYLQSEVLKVGHHGSHTSSSDLFLNIVKPAAAVIQSGRNNRYGHPAPLVLNRLKKRQIPVLRNDERGDIRMASDGEYVELIN